MKGREVMMSPGQLARGQRLMKDLADDLRRPRPKVVIPEPWRFSVESGEWENELRERLARAILVIAKTLGADPKELAKAGWYLVDFVPPETRGPKKVDAVEVLLKAAVEYSRTKNYKLAAELAGVTANTLRRVISENKKLWPILLDVAKKVPDPLQFLR